MRRTTLFLLFAGVLVILLAGARFACVERSNHAQQLVREQATARLPGRVLWVWERPEDLHGIDARAVGVAELDQTVSLGARATAVSRKQPIVLPRGISRTAVVRLEPQASFAAHLHDAGLLSATVDALLRTARQPGIAALQVDFDAKRSERPFYRALLVRLRARMPPTLPLNITALASWCSTDDWIAGLPVDEATPMFFRMEPDRRRLLATAPEYRIREPLCLHSIGVSTREPWPPIAAHTRTYIFPDGGWAQDLPLLGSAQPRLAALTIKSSQRPARLP